MTNFGALAANVAMTNKGRGFSAKGLERQIRHSAAVITRTILVCSVARPKDSHQHRELADLQPVELNKERQLALVQYKHRWGFTVSVLLRHKNGKLEARSEWLRMSGPVLLKDANPYVSTEHRRLLREVPPELVVNTGWIASPSGKQLTPEQDLQVYQELGGFQYLAQWQVPIMEANGVEVEVVS